MQQINKYDRDYLTFSDNYGRCPAFQIGLYGVSGHGKGMAEEGLIEEWKRTTDGIVIVLADPKDEAEFSFVNFPAKEKYHIQQLKKDGIETNSYPIKLYHPFTFNIPKMYLPNIDFYTFVLKDLNREDWAILSETKSDSATIRLLNRAGSELKKDEGIFMFMQNVKDMTSTKKSKKRKMGKAKNFYLEEPAGTAKSISEINALLYPFQNNYFLSNENCPIKLDYDKILLNPEPYHIFLSMWLGDLKLKEFCVLHLLNGFISAIQRLSNKQQLKKPVLFVIPEIRLLCPLRPEGYKEHLTEAIGDALNTVRSVGRGVSLIFDSQNWSGTDERIRNTGETFFGLLGSKDKEFVGKQYNKENKDRISEIANYKCSFLRFEHESDGIYRFFLPSHMHKEENYNWIEMFKAYGREMKTYDSLKKQMKDISNKEQEDVKIMIQKIIDRESAEEEAKEKEKIEKKIEKEPKKIEKQSQEITNEMAKKFYEMWKIEKKGLRQIEKELKDDPLIRIKPSIGTIRKYAIKYEKDKDKVPEINGIKNMIGDGILPEELEALNVKLD